MVLDALFLAAQDGNFPVVMAMVAVGADVNMRSVDGWTALHVAAKNGKVKVVELLIGLGADKEAQIALHNRTALHWAAFEGHLEVVELLIALGANKEAATNTGGRPLHLAAEN